MPKLPETVDIKNVEIFSAANKPNGHNYTDSMLDEIVKGFKETKDQLKPYLKFGHDDKQKLAQNSGMPALGWLDNVKRKGKKIIADLTKVPKKVAKLIEAGAYRRISAEIFWNITVNKKHYKRLLKAVALLGADTPACEDLDDIISLYASQVYKSDNEMQSYEFELENNAIKEKKEEKLSLEKMRKKLLELTIERDKMWSKRQEINDKERAEFEMKSREMSIKIQALEEKMKEVIKDKGLFYREEVTKDMEKHELEAQVKKYQEENEALKKEKEAEEKAKKEAEEKAKKEQEEKEKLQKEKDEAEKEKEKTETNSRVDKLIEAKHLLPAHKDAVVEIIMNSKSEKETKMYKIDDKEKSLEDTLISIFEQYEVKISTEDKSGTGDSSKKDNADLRDKAEKYAKEHNCSYKDALIAVSPEDK